MNRESLLTVYDRLTGLIEKLPGGLQKPILKELVPIRSLFLEHRPARLLLVGRDPRSTEQFLADMGAKLVQTGDCDNGWRTFLSPGLGGIQILDARESCSDEVFQMGIARFEPDVVLFFEAQELAEPEWQTAAARAEAVDAGLIGLAGPGLAFRLQARLAAQTRLARRVPKVLEATDAACDETICAALPLAAQLEFARVTGARRAQAHIAASLLKSFSAVCGVIAVQPIPLADMPILTTLQTLMVGLIIHTTGKPFSARLVAEFIAALGFNIGAGLVLREGARALVRVVPIWGNAVSGFVAGAGTYAIGRAAIAYFIEETPIDETRRLFKRLLPKGRKPPKLPELPG
ncbi:MAG: hypothetical protein SFU53_08250 [Terrimicrobiaceae bacterium]|nr:hypothetical protein [Terrimicrobiaceae bacterium]